MTMKLPPEVTRIEVIDHRLRDYGPHARLSARAFVAHDCQVEMDLQDGGRTLKVFVTSRPPAREPKP